MIIKILEFDLEGWIDGNVISQLCHLSFLLSNKGERMKFKYAYPNREEILISKERKPIRPFFDEEIEITKLTKDKLIGGLIRYRNSKICNNINIEDVEKQYIEFSKKYIFCGKLIPTIKSGWVRLKKRTRIEIDLKNYRIIKEL